MNDRHKSLSARIIATAAFLLLLPFISYAQQQLPADGEARLHAERLQRMLRESIPKTGEIESRCLYAWSDSHQFHSSSTIVTLSEQRVRTTWKRLDHCIRLRVTGPVDVKGIAKSYIEKCVDYGLKKNSTRHALEALIGLGIDVLSAGSTGFAATAVALADYTASVADNTIECLSDIDNLNDHLTKSLKRHFNSTVEKESSWVYWDL